MAEKKTKRAQSRRRPLTRERVLARAVRLADKDGIASLSMRRLAQALKVEAMSLYNHVKNKDDILDGMVEVIALEIEVPEIGGDWQRAMRTRAHSAHDVLMSHPWGTQLLMSRANVGPVMLRYVDATIGCLREAGFSYAIADYAWNTIDAHIYGFTLQRLNFPFEPDEYATVAEEFMPQLDTDQFPYLAGMSHAVMAGEHDGVQDLSFGLDLILEGLERLRIQS